MINYRIYFLIFAIILSSIVGYKTFEQYQSIQKTKIAILQNETITLANFVKAFRKTYQNVFIHEHIKIDDDTLHFLPVKTILNISKNFTIAQNHKIFIRTVSQRPRNPKNMVSNFERKMIKYFKENPKITHKFIQTQDSFQLIEPLYIKDSCLKCHGKKETAITSIKNRYNTAYNYKLGDIRGLLHIEIKDNNSFDILYNNFKKNLIINMIILTALLILIYLLLRYIGKKEHSYRKMLEAEIEKQTSQITKQKQKLYYQAHHDALTNLPNRALFLQELQKDIELTQKHNQKLALFFIDLDQFKQINDSLGHDIGDEVLQVASKRLQSNIKSSDFLARLGGDEFVTIINNYDELSDISKLAFKILQVIKEPIKIQEYTLYISSSIGISLYPQDALNAKELLKYADTAMYKAKDEGRNNYKFYNHKMTQKAYQKVTIISELQNALSHNEFEVYFQPQIDSTTEQTIGLEALCRWNHPTKGIILPSEFIKIAINNGIIIDIDKFIMRESMKTYARWHKEGKNPGTLSLNLTIDNIMNDGFIPYIKTCLQEFNFDPHNLVLELIESEIMQKHTKIIEKLEQLSKMGISISIDDFGIGYSSLAYLKRLPIQKLKIDHSFISNIPQDINDSYIVKAIIALASSLNIDIIAEGVETIQQKEFLEENGCNRIQGFYYAKPMSIRDIEQKIL